MSMRLLMLVATLLLIEATALAEKITFETDVIGAVPQGWTVAMTGTGTPKWTVEKDPTAPSRSNVVKQSGRATYPLLLKNGTSVKDGLVEVQFKAIAGSHDRAAGLVWRARDPHNYYVVRANALENNVVLYKTVKSQRSALDIVGRKGGYGVNVPVPAQSWHRLGVEFAGTRFKVLFNEKPIFEVEDMTFGEAGLIGLWTKADSVTSFADFVFEHMR
jgi:3-keto-disaccharide hydrolase